MKSSMKTKKGFTLIELIIVIAIIAVLASIAFMSMSKETANARDASRKEDISTFEKVIASSISKGRTINTGTVTTLTTTSGRLDTLRGAKIVEIDETIFEPTVLQKASRDPSPSGNKYIGVFLTDNIYQIFATLENPTNDTPITLTGGTFVDGIILDTLSENVALGSTVLPVNNAGRFLIGDIITIGENDSTIASVDTSAKTITVTAATTARYLQDFEIKLKTSPANAQSFLCLGGIVNGAGAAVADPVTNTTNENEFCIPDAADNSAGTIKNRSTILPYKI